MTRPEAQSWIALLASTSLLVAGSLIASPAKAETCNSGLRIQTIVNTPGGYTCQLGQLQYTFNDTMSTLALASPNSTIDFYDSPPHQTISFRNLNTTIPIGFDYSVVSPQESIDELELNYVQSPSAPPADPATISGIPYTPTPTPDGKWNASNIPLYIETAFVPEGNQQTLLYMSHTIYKSPAPLPLAGASLALGFSRKLRRRVLLASGVKRPK
ncbi:MAG: hypothetical protein ACK6BG_04825 [Cyanobacteriota bacterium]